MANFVIIVDPDPERRSRFIKTIEPLLPPVEGLVINTCATGNFQAIWAANPQAPISYNADAEGAAVIWGEAIPQSKSTRTNATTLRNLWKNPDDRAPIFDGYYAAVAYRADFGIVVGADIIGLFPVYYYTMGEVALVASSPELFRYHPLFKIAFNPAGLVGILLTNGLFDGQTLWQGVQRLDAGHLFVWKPESTPREVKQYQLPGTGKTGQYDRLSFPEHLDVLEQAIDQALTRHAPTGQKYSLLLSGGLDSRMLGGFLTRRGVDVVALTEGRPTDIEMTCAIPVARTLGIEHHTTAIEYNQYPACANLLAQWEHLANGFTPITIGWGIRSQLQNLAPKVVGGFSLGPVLGVKVAYYLPREPLSFETFFIDGVNRWGLRAKLLEKMLRKEIFGDLVPQTLERIQTTYQSYADNEFRRAWWFDIYHRQRFHIGSSWWKICFGAWPIAIFADWQLLETTGLLPPESVGKRRGQSELLCTRFPQLAALPLDRNDYNVEPLLPSQRRQQLSLLFRLQQKGRRLQNRLGFERRYYYRIFDTNNSGWRLVRQVAESNRELMRHLFDEEAFNQLVPPLDRRVPNGTDSIIETAGIKTLIGLLLWSKERL